MGEITTKKEEQKVRQAAIKVTFGEDVASEEIETLLTENTVNNDKDTVSDDTVDDKKEDDTIKANEDDKVSDVDTDRFDKILSAVQTLNQTVSTMEGRLKNSERRIGGITNELSAAKTAAAEQEVSPTKQQMQEAAKTDDSWDDLKKNFPDWANAFENKLADVTKNVVTKEDLAELRKTIKSTTEDKDIAANELKLVTLFHPQWENTVKTDEFSTWITAQPVDIINKFNYSTDAVDAIDVLNRYKDSIKSIQTNSTSDNVNEIKEIKDSREKRLAESVLSKTNHNIIKPKTEADMTEEELREHIAAKVFKER